MHRRFANKLSKARGKCSSRHPRVPRQCLKGPLALRMPVEECEHRAYCGIAQRHRQVGFIGIGRGKICAKGSYEQNIGKPGNNRLRSWKPGSRFALEKIEDRSHPRVDTLPATPKMNDVRKYCEQRVGHAVLEMEATT